MAALPKEMNYRDRLQSGGMGTVTKRFIQPTNGSTFTPGSSFSEFHIPGSRANTFADLKNLYVALSLTVAANGNGIATMSNAGVFNCVERIEVDSSAGVRLFETRAKDVIDGLKIIEVMDDDDLSNAGSVMFGSRQNVAVAGIVVDTTARQFVLPLINMSINQSMIPLFGNDGLRFRIHWAPGYNYFTYQDGSTATAAAINASISSVSMHYDTVKLMPEDMAGLYAELDGRFVITGNDIAHQVETMNSTSLNANLGFGRTKCKKIYATARTTTSLANTDLGVLIQSHSYTLTTLTNTELRYNGALINEQSYTFSADNCAVIAAEAMKSAGMTFLNLGGQKNPDTYATAIDAPTSAQATGDFYIMWDLTSGADTVMGESGLDTRTGTFQLELTASADPAATIDIFCEYENQIVLDTKADNVFRVRS